ncbi:MAG: asparagine synthase (glutamine-hydrolyzing) [Verrucomicrobiaceae bacterium]|nr:asparagine synthase (glutamine-hydrolyzing) [Verrucomicrobiaceae bacterium]
MCGICGEFLLGPGKQADAARLRAMQQTIVHRGPNDDGQLVHGPCGLGFRRLSIIDLEGGHQPISNEDATVWVTLNGEIYNYPELRKELEELGHQFQTHSDTEVIVHLYEEHGVDFPKRLRGMFGIALYDLKHNKFLLVRDRLGIKPIYVWQDSERIVYGSEIKALLAHPSVSSVPHLPGVNEFLVLRHSVTPDTMFAGIQKLPPASVLEVGTDGKVQTRTYWQMRHSAPPIRNMAEAVDAVERALVDAVECHLLADVPLGMFLSGGLDSSVIAALVQQRSSRPVVCFTASFKGEQDESPHAAAVARHLGAEHRLLPIEQPPPELLEELVWHLDEPIADPACLPTFLLSREAAKEVRVVLTGEGSDETNAGYSKFLRYHLYQRYPMAMKAAQWLGLKRFSQYRPLCDANDELERLLALDDVRGRVPTNKLKRVLDNCDSQDPTMRMLEYARCTFMQEDLLMKVDRMTMAHGLEARVPFLDHSLAEVTARIHPSVLFEGKRTKAVLRAVAKKLLPDTIVQRRQHGFIVPLSGWFSGDFVSYVRGLLAPATIKKRGVVSAEDAAAILAAYEKDGSQARMVWSLVLLELWFRRFMD